MKEIGRVKVKEVKPDKTKYVGTCPCCGTIYEFTKQSISYVQPKPTTYVGEFNMKRTHNEPAYYAAYCPKDGAEINLGDEKGLAGHIKNKRKREQELDKFYVDYTYCD